MLLLKHKICLARVEPSYLCYPLKRHEKNASENVVCCKKLPNITDELSIGANSVDPGQTAPRSSLVWVHTVCHNGFLNISADEKSRRLLLQLAY